MNTLIQIEIVTPEENLNCLILFWIICFPDAQNTISKTFHYAKARCHLTFLIYQNSLEYPKLQFFECNNFHLQYMMFELVIFNNIPKLSSLTNARLSRISKKYFRCIYVCLCYQQPPKHMYFKRNKTSFIKGILLAYLYPYLSEGLAHQPTEISLGTEEP